MENTQKTPETLKPEQMESGKWYVIITQFKFLSKFKELFENKILEYKGYSYYGDRINGDIPLAYLDDIKSIRPATKEEVLKYFPYEVFEPIELRSEETTDWEAKYNELKVENDSLKVIYRLQSEKKAKIEAYNDELTERINQLEQKGEKVYFYFNEKKGHISFTENLETALNHSPQDNEIYEAICIGKKKSVLVNETT